MPMFSQRAILPCRGPIAPAVVSVAPAQSFTTAKTPNFTMVTRGPKHGLAIFDLTVCVDPKDRD